MKAVSFKRYWTNNKLSIAVQKSNGDVKVYTADPVTRDLFVINIPGDTQISVSRQLGIWKVNSLWELGKNEKVGGKLLAESLTHSIHLPIYVYMDGTSFDLSNPSIFRIIPFVFFPNDTNLSIGDKFALYTYLLSIRSTRHQEFDLKDTSLLKKAKLTDGNEGYLITANKPQNILSIFSEDQITIKPTMVTIIDSTGNPKIPQSVGELVEVLGAKVASIKAMSENDTDCLVSSSNSEIVRILSLSLNCREKSERGEDTVIYLGKTFAVRY